MIILLLLFSLGFFSKYDLYYNLSDNNNIFKINGCFFNITYNYSVSPLISPSFFPKVTLPEKSNFSQYYYIYLTFNIPIEQKQKNFYLEAYNISDGMPLTSNGNCYFINVIKNSGYELRIYKNLRTGDYFR